MTTATDLPASILSRLAELDKQRDELLAHTDTARIAEECMAATGVGSHVGAFAHGVVYYLPVMSGTIEHAVAPVLRHLRKLGFRVGDKRVNSDDRIVNVFAHRGNQSINVYCTLAGAACHFVQVGTREVPVMELRCDGAAE